VATVLLLVVLRRAPIRGVVLVIGCQVVSLALGTALRRPFAHIIGSSASSYIKWNEIGAALSSFGVMVHAMWSHPSERIELAVIVALTAIAVTQFVLLMQRPRHSTDAPSGAALVVVTFAVLAPVIDVVGVLTSGNSTNRYFLPVVMFPLLALVPLVDHVPSMATSTRRVGLAGLGVIGASIVGVLALSPVLTPLFNPSAFAGGQCLARDAAIRGRTGIGDFWTSRTLDTYASGGTHVLQVLPNFLPQGWLVNLGEFDHRTVTFVIVDHTVSPRIGLTAADTDRLGAPTSITSCPGFAIYSYPSGTHGFTVLNQQLDLWDSEVWPQRR
jgi:hypothetical protein